MQIVSRQAERRAPSSIDLYETAIATVADARSFDLRAAESEPLSVVLSSHLPRVAALVDEAIANLATVLDRYDNPSSASSSPCPSASFGGVVDRMMLGEVSSSQIADLAFVSICELRQKRSRLEHLSASTRFWDAIEILGSAIRGVVKSLAAVATMIARLKGYQPCDALRTEVETAIQVRREFARLRETIGQQSPEELDELRARLRRIGTGFAILIGRDVYPRIRTGDRVQLRELQRRVLEWLGQTEYAGALRDGQRLWQDLFSFGECLRQINRRVELGEHDRDVARELTNLIPESLHAPMSADVQALASRLEGLDAGCDALIQRGVVSWKRWAPELRKLNERLSRPPVVQEPSNAGFELDFGLAGGTIQYQF